MKQRRLVVALAAACLLLVAACSSSSTGGTKAGGEKTDSALHNALPASVRNSGTLKVVTLGPQPPYFIPGTGNQYTGAGAELAEALVQVLGVKIQFATLTDISTAIAAVRSGRYDLGFGPFGDTTGSSAAVTPSDVEYIDFVKEFVPFLVKKGNPKHIQSLDTLCDATVAAQANGGAYVLLEKQAQKCKSSSKGTLNVIGLDGVPNGVLAVESGRVDAFFSSAAPLIYYSKKAPGQLELAGTTNPNGFADLFQGLVVPAGSPLAPALLGAFRKLFSDGTYKQVMMAAGLDREILDSPGINLASKASKGS